MKKLFFALKAFALLLACVACSPDNGGNQNNPEALTVTGAALDVTDYTAILTGYANLPADFTEAKVGVLYDKGQSFDDAKKIVAPTRDENNLFTVTIIGLESSTTYYFKSFVENGTTIEYGDVKSFTTQESKCPAGAVDLGIVMTRKDGSTYKLYWAKSNLSASGLCPNPEDYGDYYAWGETAPKQNYSWTTYKFRVTGDKDENVTFSKYILGSTYVISDGKTVLDPEDDAALSQLGGNWRMPTAEEVRSLISNKYAGCTQTWTTQNDVKGYLITASNGNSIFLPAAGDWKGSKLENAPYRAYYWSSSLTESDKSQALVLYFSSSDNYIGRHSRYYGLPIRPVSE